MGQRILDLDLDFFLNEVAYHRTPDDRVSSDECRPWSARKVRKFLEKQCGLTHQDRVPGRFVSHHHEAFYFWQELIQKKKLSIPFEVIHVDAHADLGGGSILQDYFFGQFLHQPFGQREIPSSSEPLRTINAGNYLCYALAFRWLSSLIYVKHPKCGDDLLRLVFKDRDPKSGCIQLPLIDPQSMDETLWVKQGKGKAIGYEPEVPFREMLGSEFWADGPFDFMVLCHSPGFTPRESDSLIPVIREYMSDI